MRNGAGTGVAQSQLLKVGQLMRAIGSADASTLVAMQASVAGLVGEAQAIAQEGRDAANRADGGDTLTAIDARTRATVQRIGNDVFARKVFDPYLRFDSAEDEEAYRKREAEREATIKRELAKGTPEGNRNAAALLEEQILDAGAHGANASPDYTPMLNDAQKARAELGAALEREASKSLPTPAKPAQSNDPMDDIMASLQAAGVVSGEERQTSGHGLTDGARVAGLDSGTGRGAS
ncbi:hypothetical protein [Sphingopyxis sp. GC21]|uniref:hypothetical protein n=1 Tax=Sphingopyxis sp. GC21 TaxID=2933562 RepID=UPI0021E40738|nr:hypothetical protein [Sphingopyxis sp. GC21]